jgi:hypothetical protein
LLFYRIFFCIGTKKIYKIQQATHPHKTAFVKGEEVVYFLQEHNSSYSIEYSLYRNQKDLLNTTSNPSPQNSLCEGGRSSVFSARA